MDELRRALTRVDATALAVGTMIGTGILLKPAVMAQEVASPALLLLAWVVAGALTLAGALTYAELATLFPRAGGEYVYIREAFGRGPAFVYGGTRFLIGGASTAAYGVAFATFLSALVPLDAVWLRASRDVLGVHVAWHLGARDAVAVALIALIAGVNCLGVLAGGRLQTVLAAAKVAGLLVLVVGLGVVVARGGRPDVVATVALAPGAGSGGARGGLAGFGAAVLAAVWAYAGWFMVPMAAGEVRDARRTLPWALGAATLLVVAAYLLVNLSFLAALPFDQIAASSSTRHPAAPSVATRAATVLLGAGGGAFATVLFLVAVVGSLNGTLLAVPRIPFAMARDGQLPPVLGRIGRRSQVPVWPVALLGGWGIVLASTGTFDQLTTVATFFYCVGYGANAAGLFVLRRRLPHAERPFRVPGWVAGGFLLGALWLLGNTVRTNPRETLAALALVGAAGAAYLVARWRRGGRGTPTSRPAWAGGDPGDGP